MTLSRITGNSQIFQINLIKKSRHQILSPIKLGYFLSVEANRKTIYQTIHVSNSRCNNTTVYRQEHSHHLNIKKILNKISKIY